MGNPQIWEHPADKPMGDLRNQCYETEKNGLNLGVNLNDSFLVFHASPVLGIHGSLKPLPLAIDDHHDFLPEEGEGQILKLAMGQTGYEGTHNLWSSPFALHHPYLSGWNW